MLSWCEGTGTSTSALLDDLTSDTDDSDFNPQDAEELEALHMDQQADAEMEGMEENGQFENEEALLEIERDGTRYYVRFTTGTGGDSDDADENEEDEDEDNEPDEADDDDLADRLPAGLMQQLNQILNRTPLRWGSQSLHGTLTMSSLSHPIAHNVEQT